MVGVDLGAPCDRAATARPARPAPASARASCSATPRRCRSADGGFDVALSRVLAVHVPRQARAAIAEMARVVRPGGTLAIADVTADLDALPAALRTAAARVACVADARSADEYAALLRDAGCEPLAIEPHDAELRAMADRVEARLRVARMLAPPGEQRERVARPPRSPAWRSRESPAEASATSCSSRGATPASWQRSSPGAPLRRAARC